MGKIEGLAHLGFFVDDMDRSIQFYTDVLGFSLRCRWEVPGVKAALLLKKNQNLMLYLHQLVLKKSLLSKQLEKQPVLALQKQKLWLTVLLKQSKKAFLKMTLKLLKLNSKKLALLLNLNNLSLNFLKSQGKFLGIFYFVYHTAKTPDSFIGCFILFHINNCTAANYYIAII